MTDDAVHRICFDLAKRLHLGEIQPRIVGRFSNLAVALDPVPIVARIATGTSLLRDTRAFARREVNIARYLAGRQCSVIPPCSDPIAGPHAVAGWTVTLWTLVDVLAVLPDPIVSGKRLAQCHVQLRDYAEQLPYFTAFDEIDRILLQPHVRSVVSPEERAWIAHAANALRMQLAPYRAQAQMLHGDSHRKNVICTPAGPLWTDWEDAIYAPIEWDLACLVTNARITGQDFDWAEAALASYGPYDHDALALCIRARALFGAAWLALLSADNPSRLERLAAWFKWLRTE